jgi:hypothetical protein
MGGILVGSQLFPRGWLIEAGPTTARIVFGATGKQGLATYGASIGSLLVVVHIAPGEPGLGLAQLGDTIGQFIEVGGGI